MQSGSGLRWMELLTAAVCLAMLGGCERTSALPPEVAEPVKTPQLGWIDAARIATISHEPGAWLTGGRDYQQSYYSPLQQINRDNVSRLGFAWQYEIDTEHGFEATPIVVDGVMYTSGPAGAVYAVNAATGAEMWKFEPEVAPEFMRKTCCGVVNRGVAVWRGRVYVGSLDGYLYALDANDGSVAWKVDTITDRGRGYTITGAPYIARDLVVIGNAGAEFDARGYITAYDHASGEQRWRFFIVPGDPRLGFEHPELEIAAKTWDPQSLWEVGLGGTAWDAMAYDPELDLLYVGTGNAAPYPRKLRSPAGGDNLFLASILALDPDDGRMVWYYQTTPADNWDFTATMKMILADLEIDGQTRQVIMQAPKNGFFYVLDRRSGELISAEPYVKVTWASHVDKQTGKPVETGQGEYFYGAKLVFPSPAGGHNWQPMAFNPESGLVYIPVIEAGTFWIMPEEPFEYQKGGLNSTSIYIFPMRGDWGLDGAAAERLPPLAELTAGQPDTTIRGFVRAWNPVTQKLAWEVETSGQWVGELFATWNGGGLMTTAGGLVFQGRGTGQFIALDAATGKQLTSIDTGTSMMAGPMTYTVSGEQYVAIMAGLGGAAGQEYVPGTAAYKYGNKGRIIAFKLGGGAVPKRPEVEHASAVFPMPPVARRGTPEQLRLGAELYVRNCTKCHANTDGRSAGIPDLRKLSAQAHQNFNDVMLKGTLASKGMGNFSGLLSPQEVEAIHSYLIDLAWQTYEAAQAANRDRQPAAPHTPKADD
jgi:quinohemoprotein ethanol dehydrogenase